MKNTKAMIAFIITYLLFWFFIAGLAWVLTGNPYRELLSNMNVGFFSGGLGWIPAFIVVIDMHESRKIRKNTTEIDNKIIDINQSVNKFRSHR